MREIKFRVWLPKANKMVYEIQQDNDLGDIITDHNYDNGNYILMQYTGLKDKNGDEIYEGDILREYSNEIEDWVVLYEYGKFVGTSDNVWEDLYELSDLEVIGNIYDNPYLLKE